MRKKFSHPSLKELHYVAIDKIAVSKEHRCVTIVLDLECGAVVFVGDGKGTEALGPPWKRPYYSGARVEGVFIDIPPAYLRATQ